MLFFYKFRHLDIALTTGRCKLSAKLTDKPQKNIKIVLVVAFCCKKFHLVKI